jgi:hypothetical protein
MAAVEKGDGTLDKEATNHDDLVDAWSNDLKSSTHLANAYRYWEFYYDSGPQKDWH